MMGGGLCAKNNELVCDKSNRSSQTYFTFPVSFAKIWKNYGAATEKQYLGRFSLSNLLLTYKIWSTTCGGKDLLYDKRRFRTQDRPKFHGVFLNCFSEKSPNAVGQNLYRRICFLGWSLFHVVGALSAHMMNML